MSNVKAFYTPQGIVMGEATEQTDGTWFVKNPVMAIPQRDNMALFPFLQIMEETTIALSLDDFQYGRAFTPNVEMRNHYNKMFGSGIIEAGSNALVL